MELLKSYLKVVKRVEDKKVVKLFTKSIKNIIEYKIKIVEDIMKKYGGKDSKKARYIAASFLVITDSLLNSILLTLVVKLAKNVHNYEIGEKGNIGACIRRAIKNLRNTAPSGIVIYTEETSKAAAAKTGILKEYLTIFLALENAQYINAGRLLDKVYQKVTNGSLPYFVEGMSIESAKRLSGMIGLPHSIVNKTLEKKQGTLVIYEYNRGALTKVHIIGRVLASAMHLFVAFLHKLELTYPAAIVHLVWNVLLSDIIGCLILTVGKTKLLTRAKVITVKL